MEKKESGNNFTDILKSYQAKSAAMFSCERQ